MKCRIYMLNYMNLHATTQHERGHVISRSSISCIMSSDLEVSWNISAIIFSAYLRAYALSYTHNNILVRLIS